MQELIEDLNNIDKMILHLKYRYEPTYKELLISWRNRRDEIKKKISMCVCRELAYKIVVGEVI